MQELLNTLEDFLESGVDEILEDNPQNLLDKSNNVNTNLIINDVPDASNLKKLVEEITPTYDATKDAMELAAQAENIDSLRDAINDFTGCALYKTAKNTVFSDGVVTSNIVLVGEAPGSTEDEQGIPFCGISGKLLDDIFNSIGYTRKNNLYITNSVFWRPPGNRRPTEEEIAICRPFVEKHIALLQPKLIVLVGSTALASLLPNVTETISRFRGKFVQYDNQYLDNPTNITAIFHPSYLLRQPGKKKLIWHDIVKIKQFLING